MFSQPPATRHQDLPPSSSHSALVAEFLTRFPTPPLRDQHWPSSLASLLNIEQLDPKKLKITTKTKHRVC
jgi:hypothetical protein